MTNKELLSAKQAERKKIKTALDECDAVIKLLKGKSEPTAKPATKSTARKTTAKPKPVKK